MLAGQRSIIGLMLVTIAASMGSVEKLGGLALEICVALQAEGVVFVAMSIVTIACLFASGGESRVRRLHRGQCEVRSDDAAAGAVGTSLPHTSPTQLVALSAVRDRRVLKIAAGFGAVGAVFEGVVDVAAEVGGVAGIFDSFGDLA